MDVRNYAEIARNYLEKAFGRGLDVLEKALPATAKEKGLVFKAFGKTCKITKEKIFLDDLLEEGPKGVLVSLYAFYTPVDSITTLTTWKSFKDFPGTMPYWEPFRANAEQVLIPFVETIHRNQQKICNHFDGYIATNIPGDFSMVLFPFPKVPLLYIFYLPDDEFPAEAKCLFAGGDQFMPVDALADIAEHTSRTIIELIKGEKHE